MNVCETKPLLQAQKDPEQVAPPSAFRKVKQPSQAATPAAAAPPPAPAAAASSKKRKPEEELDEDAVPEPERQKVSAMIFEMILLI